MSDSNSRGASPALIDLVKRSQKYRTSNGEPATLYTMMLMEPDWVMSRFRYMEEQITLKESMIEVLSVDAAVLNAALIDIINGKKEKQSAILLPDYEAYDSDGKKRKWAKAEALKRLEATDERG